MTRIGKTPIGDISLDALAAYYAVHPDDYSSSSTVRVVSDKLRAAGVGEEYQAELAGLLFSFCDPKISSMSISPDPLTGEVRAMLMDENTVVRKVIKMTEKALQALASLLISIHKMNIPMGESATAVSVASSAGKIGFVRWTIRRQVSYRSEVSREGEILVFARKITHGGGAGSVSLDQLAQKTHPDVAKIIRGHLLGSPRAVLVVCGPPFSGKTTLLNAILNEAYQTVMKDIGVAFYGDAVDNPYPPDRAFFVRPTDPVSDNVVLTRSNVSALVIGEVTSSATAKVMVDMLNVMRLVFTTLHATTQGGVSGVAHRISSLAGVSDVEFIERNLTMVVEMGMASRGDGNIVRWVRYIWERKPSGEMTLRFRADLSPVGKENAEKVAHLVA